MRKEYKLENKTSLVWGFDKTGGFFVQVFDDSDEDREILLVNADQSDKLSQFSISDEFLTLEKMNQYLSHYNEKAYQDFYRFIKSELNDIVIGYLLVNAEGRYRDKIYMHTFKDFFSFVDHIEHGYMLTDKGDKRIDIYDLFLSLPLS